MSRNTVLEPKPHAARKAGNRQFGRHVHAVVRADIDAAMAYHSLAVELDWKDAETAADGYLARNVRAVVKSEKEEPIARELRADDAAEAGAVEAEFLLNAVLEIDHGTFLGEEILAGFKRHLKMLDKLSYEFTVHCSSRFIVLN